MENTLRAPVSKSYSGQHLLLLAFVALLGLWYYQTSSQVQHTQRDRMKMEKSSGKNGKHANADARKSAEEKYQKVREEWMKLRSKSQKNAEDKKLQQQLEKQLKHLEKKKSWKGENHSQKHKGN